MARMRTTVDLPAELWIRAKKRAAEERTSLREILVRGLRRELAGTPAESGPSRIRWVVVDGGLPGSLDLSSRLTMHDRFGPQSRRPSIT